MCSKIAKPRRLTLSHQSGIERKYWVNVSSIAEATGLSTKNTTSASTDGLSTYENKTYTNSNTEYSSTYLFHVILE